MKPYIGILIDSFWEAVHSKVLWALLVASTFVLAVLAPFALTIERGFKFSNSDINSALRNQLLEKLAKALDGQGSAGAQAIASRLDEKFQERLKRKFGEAKANEEIRTRELVEQLNLLLADRQLYRADAFPSTAQMNRYKEIVDKLPDQASEAEVEELNRRLLFATFSGEINPSRGEQIFLTYAGFKLTDPLAFTQKQVKELLAPLVLMSVLKLGLAIIVIFVAIIVTSPIIPDTFRSGSLHLMLSKPISRSWLFLSKFFGGCVFVTLNFIYVILGLYLIAGLRFDMWNNGLLACLPLLLFVFVIFYSVSSLAGLLWGNAIVCVVSCLIFWGFCFTIGTLREVMHDPVARNQVINRLAEVDGQLLSINEVGKLQVWNSTHSVWQPATDGRTGFGAKYLTFGPIFDAQRRVILTKSFAQAGPFDGMGGSGQRQLLVIDADEHKPSSDSDADENVKPNMSASGSASIDAAKVRETGYWSTENGPDIPLQVSNILSLEGDVVAVCRTGLYVLNWDAVQKTPRKSRLDDAAKNIQNMLGIKANRAEDGPFRLASPGEFTVTDNSSVAASRTGRSLFAYTSGKLTLLELRDGKFVIEAESKLDGDGTEAALVAANEEFCLVGRPEVPIQILSRQLSPLGTVSLPRGQTIKQWQWHPSRQNALYIVTQQGSVFELDCQQQTCSPAFTSVRGRVTSLLWKDADQVYLGIAPNRVVLVNAGNQQVVQDYSPQLRTFEKVFNWAINPLYIVNPKPAALDDSMAYLLTGKTTFDENLLGSRLDNAKRELSIWQPILSNLAFVLVILGICCYYVSRKEY